MEKELKKCWVKVPERYRKWKDDVNRQNKAMGLKAVSIKRIVQSVLDHMAENGFEGILEKMSPESLEDTRCGPGRTAKKKV